jgi:hypothetical protein
MRYQGWAENDEKINEIWQLILDGKDKDFRVKGKCTLGPFLSILVIKCPTQVPKFKLCQRTQEVQIKIKGMFLDLVHCFED